MDYQDLQFCAVYNVFTHLSKGLAHFIPIFLLLMIPAVMLLKIYIKLLTTDKGTGQDFPIPKTKANRICGYEPLANGSVDTRKGFKSLLEV